MMKKKYILPIVGVTIAMLIFIALRISLAYLTDTESADNVITVGSVNLQISEGSFAQSSVIAEGQKLNKAPKIINTGKNALNHVVLLSAGKVFSSADYIPELGWNVVFSNLVYSVSVTNIGDNIVILLCMILRNDDGINCRDYHYAYEKYVGNLK